MRLTLRTLLALRDGVLDRSEAADLEQRLRQSTTAQAIEKRIAAVVSDRRIPGLSLDERGVALDANNVARFLDDSLPTDRVPEFERKCLENNSLLSEVAACHEILTRAVQDAVPISLSLRSRIYALDPRHASGRAPGNRTQATDSAATLAERTKTGRTLTRSDASHPIVDAPHAVAATNKQSPSANHEDAPSDGQDLSTSSPAAGSRAGFSRTGRDLGGAGLELNDTLGQQVPEYLQLEQRHRFANLAKVAGLLALLGLTSALALGPWQRVIELWRPQSRPASLADQSSSPAGVSKLAPREVKPDEAAGTNAASPSTPAAAASNGTATEESPNALNHDIATDVNSDREAPSRDDPPGNAKPKRDPREPIQTIPQARWQSPQANDRWIAMFSERPNPVESPNATDRWQSHILGRDPSVSPSSAWLLMPGTRNEFQWPNGQRWAIAGDAMITWPKPTDAVAPIGVIARNMLVLLGPGQRLQVSTPTGTAWVLSEAGSSVIGLETVDHRIRIDPSSTPMTVDTIWQTNLVAVQGNCSVFWQANASQPTTEPGALVAEPNAVTLRPSEYVAIDGGFLLGPQLTETAWPRDMPRDEDWNAWTARNPNAPNEDADLLQRLSDAAASSRGDAAAVAIRARIQLGQFDHLFGPDGAFQRPELQPHWSRILDQMVRSLAKPEYHNRFLDAIRAQTAERYSQILRLLSWPTAEELAAGGDKFLVDALSDSRIDVRALAILQLSAIVGDDLGYNPAVPSAESIQRWKTALNQQRIRFALSISSSSPELP